MSQSTNNASVKTSFELALDKFRAQLSDQERVKFAVTKKGDLLVAILNIQNEQRLSKKMVNMRRAQGFIEAMEQFGKVIEVFVNSSEILAFVWGPMKFLLLSAKSWTDSTNELLDTYQHIADSLPIFEGYQDLFKEDGVMQETLKHVWEVILDFHLEALAHLRQRMAKKIFHAVWKDFKSRFQPKLDDLNRLKKLIDRHARQLHMRRYEADRASTETHWAKLFAELAQNRKASSEDKKYQRLRRCREIQSWINPPAAIEDHEEQLRVREDLQKATNKQTGRWILENKEVRSWLGPDVPRSSIVWVHGVHGAEYEMSLVCLQYLTFDCNFDSEYRPELEEVEGQTAFQDYAAAHWADHVLKMIEVADRAPGTDEPSIPSEDMAHAIGDFGEIYRIDLVVGRDVSPPSPRALSRLGLPASFDIIWRIAQHVDSLRGTGDPDDAVHPSTLARAVTRSRAALESRVLQSDQDEKRILAKYHGENSFKCWRRTCYHFHEGFGLKEEREHHLNRHKKPFECTEPDCDFRLYGFASMPELKKHRRNHHPDNFSTSFPRPPKKTKPRKVAELKFKCEFEGCTAAFSRSPAQETFQGRGLEEVVKVVCLFEAWGVGYRT
uniref:DUF7708 domain-containing protein n=1 Tax=Pyricularia oryzae (strain P131) TaxID=1143193 RepID=L7J9W7_PYRO1